MRRFLLLSTVLGCAAHSQGAARFRDLAEIVATWAGTAVESVYVGRRDDAGPKLIVHRSAEPVSVLDLSRDK